MNRVVAIAINTFKEAVRNRILYIILIFALLLIAASGIVSELTIADRTRVIKNLGFAAINLFGVAIAVFVGVSLVYNEIERRTIYTIVSKPISRWQFLLGKFFGLLLTIYVNVFIMTVFFMFMVHYQHGKADFRTGWFELAGGSVVKTFVNLFAWNAYPEVTAGVMQVVVATLVELAIVTALAILFSSFTTPTLSMFFTILTFIAGRLNESIIDYTKNLARLAERKEEALSLSYYLAKGAALITPNLQVFSDTVEHALYEDEVRLWAEAVPYAILYVAATLFLSMLIFSRRNFK